MVKRLSDYPENVQPKGFGHRTGQGGVRVSPLYMAPKFEPLAFTAIQEWSVVESSMISIVALFSGGSAEILFNLFMKSNNNTFKSNIMNELIKSKVRAKDIEIWKAIRKMHDHCADRRNMCAHGLWSYIRDRDDIVAVAWPSIGIDGPAKREEIEVWDEDDFRDLIMDMDALSDLYGVMRKLGRGTEEDRDMFADWYKGHPRLKKWLPV